jgi:NAD(P)H dehydrogenase (quinone)
MTNKAHIVFTDPGPDALIRDVCDTAAAALQQGGWQVSSSEQSDFAPASRERFTQEAALTSECDLLVMAFPMIWCAPPAAMKRWTEQVFADGLHDGRQMNLPGCMKGRRAIVIAPLAETAGLMRGDSLHSSMTDLLSPLLEGTLGYLGFDVLRPHFFAQEDLQHALGRKALADEVSSVFLRMASRPHLFGLLRQAGASPYPSMF